MTWTGNINGVINPAKVDGVAVADIFTINDVQTDSVPLVINIISIDEDSEGTCQYPPAGDCTAQSTFSATIVDNDGPITYQWATDVGSIIGGNTNPTCVVEITAGVDEVDFNVTLIAGDDSENTDQQISPFSQTRSESGGGETVAVEDTFTDTDGVNIVDHTPDIDTVGDGWIGDLSGGTPANYFIQSNELVRLSGTAQNGPSIDTGLSDCIISADVSRDANNNVGINFRNTSTGSSSSWRVVLQNANTTLRFMEAGTGVADSIYDFSGAVAAGKMTVTLKGQNIYAGFSDPSHPNDPMGVEYNGAVSNETVQQHGLISRAATYTMDNFKVVPYSDIIIQDTFTDTPGTALPDHAPDVDTIGGGWISKDSNSGGYAINANGTTVSRTGNPDMGPWMESGATNCIIELDILVNAGGSRRIGIGMRRDPLNSNIFNLNAIVENDQFQIREGGTIVAGPVTVSPNTGLMKVTLDGTSVTAEMSGEILNVASSSGAGATQHGLEIRFSTGASQLDSFTVKHLP